MSVHFIASRSAMNTLPAGVALCTDWTPDRSAHSLSSAVLVLQDRSHSTGHIPQRGVQHIPAPRVHREERWAPLARAQAAAPRGFPRRRAPAARAKAPGWPPGRRRPAPAAGSGTPAASRWAPRPAPTRSLHPAAQRPSALRRSRVYATTVSCPGRSYRIWLR